MPRKNKILWVWRALDPHWAVVSTAPPAEFDHDVRARLCIFEIRKALGFTPTETPERIRLSVERLDR